MFKFLMKHKFGIAAAIGAGVLSSVSSILFKAENEAESEPVLNTNLTSDVIANIGEAQIGDITDSTEG